MSKDGISRRFEVDSGNSETGCVNLSKATPDALTANGAGGPLPDEEQVDVVSVTLDVSNSKKLPMHIQRFVSEVVSAIQGNAALAEALKAGHRLVVNIPKGIEEGLESGALKLMTRSEDGEQLAVVVNAVGPKKGKVFKYLSLGEEQVDVRAAQADFAQSLSNIAIQQQLGTIIVQLNEVRGVMELVAENQKAEQSGRIAGATNSIRMALRSENDETRSSLLRGAIRDLNLALGPVQESIRLRVEHFEPVPSSQIELFGKMLFSASDYTDGVNERFNAIADLFTIYDRGVQATMLAALLLGEPAVAHEALEEEMAFLTSPDLPLRRLETIKRLYPQLSLEGEWFHEPGKHVESHCERLAALAGEIDGDRVIELTGLQNLLTLPEGDADDSLGRTEGSEGSTCEEGEPDN